MCCVCGVWCGLCVLELIVERPMNSDYNCNICYIIIIMCMSCYLCCACYVCRVMCVVLCVSVHTFLHVIKDEKEEER